MYNELIRNVDIETITGSTGKRGETSNGELPEYTCHSNEMTFFTSRLIASVNLSLSSKNHSLQQFCYRVLLHQFRAGQRCTNTRPLQEVYFISEVS